MEQDCNESYLFISHILAFSPGLQTQYFHICIYLLLKYTPHLDYFFSLDLALIPFHHSSKMVQGNQ